jgi:hypothetical protein
MKRKMNVSLLSTLGILALVAGSVSSGKAQSGYTVKINNLSDYAIYEVHLSAVNDPNWRGDLLGRQALPSGFSFTFGGTLRGHYDLKLVDEDDDVCIVPDVEVRGTTVWDINNSWLLNCEFH